MAEALPVDWTLRFLDPALEHEFRVYQRRITAESIRSGIPSILVSWIVAHVAIGVFAPQHLFFATVFFATVVYPIFVGTLIYARRAQSQQQHTRLEPLVIACDVASCAALIAVAQVRIGSSLLGIAGLVFLMFLVGISTRRRTQQTAGILAAAAVVYQVTLVWQHARGAVDAQVLWTASIVIWLAPQQAFMLARAAERSMRQGFLLERTVAAQHEQIREEKARSERLLRNILPESIATKLRDNPETIAEHHPEASVLFADVSGFTSMSAGMSAAEVVGMLNEVFTEFDTLVELHHLEKIKTIGDCYMVAAGVPEARSDHASALVTLALAMRDVVAARTFSGRRLAFRFGINSGPVVAGVIGRSKFIYDLWGDTVNVASRMESHGQVNTLQITERTQELVSGAFRCEARGAVEIKGKGEMRVWHVAGPA